jgi:hypothetical protein
MILSLSLWCSLWVSLLVNMSVKWKHFCRVINWQIPKIRMYDRIAEQIELTCKGRFMSNSKTYRTYSKQWFIYYFIYEISTVRLHIDPKVVKLGCKDPLLLGGVASLCMLQYLLRSFGLTCFIICRQRPPPLFIFGSKCRLG